MKHLARSTLIVSAFFAFDKVIGFVRQLLVTRQFSLSYELDAFNAANNIPDLLSSLISGGALGVALIPVLSEYLDKRGKTEAWHLFSRILNLAFIATAALAAVLALLAPVLVDKVIAPGFPLDKKELTISLMQLDLIAITIFSISGLCMAGLQANQHFLLPALAPGLYNLGQIFGALVLSPSEPYRLGPVSLPAYGIGIHGIVYGVIIGAMLHLLIQVPGLIIHKFEWIPSLGLQDSGVKRVLRLMGPRVLTMFFIQLFFIVRDNLASGLGEGAITALNLGWFIMQVPETLVGTAIAIALLPTISEIFARRELDVFKNTINLTIRVILSLTLPMAVLISIGIRPLVEVAFSTDAAGTEMVVTATRLYLMGLVGHALLEIGSRSFYAQQNAVIPLIAAAANSIVYIIGANVFSRLYGFAGIAATNSVVFTIEAIVLLVLLARQFPGLLEARKTLARVLLGTLLGTAILIGIIRLPLPAPEWLIYALGMGVGLSVALAFAWPELATLLKLETRKQSLQ